MTKKEVVPTFKLHMLLKQYGVTQKELSEATGIHKNSIHDFVHNKKKRVELSQLYAIMKFFNLASLDSLISFEYHITNTEVEKN